MKYIGWIVAVLVILTQLGAQGGQKAKSDLTWEELKRQQNLERADFLQAQKESLAKTIDEQKAELEIKLGTVFSSDMPEMMDKMIALRKQHSEERKEIMKAQSEERVKEGETWAAERKAYLSGS